MSVRAWMRSAAGALLALGLAAGTAGAAGAAEPVEGFGWLDSVSPRHGEVLLLAGERLEVTKATRVVDADGAPVGLGELLDESRASRRVYYVGRRFGHGVELEKLVVGIEPAQ